VALLAWTGCQGPRPVIERVDSSPGGDDRVRVAVTLRNAGSGEGQVELTVTVRDRAGAPVRARQERALTLGPRERLTVTLELPVAGAPPGDLVAEAEVAYPPG
jgi:hypothetical protein